MYTKIMTVTPKLAQAWLCLNDNNRNLNMKRAKTLADTISLGHWRLNGESIKISETGQLLDGQHRLMAITMANTPVESCVTYGVPDDVFSTMDQGAKRTTGDILGIHGIANPIQVASAAGVVFRFLSGETPSAYFKSATSTSDIEEFVLNNPLLGDAVRIAERCRKVTKNGQIVAAFWFLAQLIDRETADSFIEHLIRGDNMGMNHPVKVLREKIFADLGSTAKLPKLVLFAFFIKAWNAFREGREIKFLRWREGEDFPVME